LSWDSVGWRLPRSQAEMVEGETPTRSASSACVQCRCLRSCLIVGTLLLPDIAEQLIGIAGRAKPLPHQSYCFVRRTLTV
jgi:hypothetical protein